MSSDEDDVVRKPRNDDMRKRALRNGNAGKKKKVVKKKKKLANENLQGASGGYAWEDEIKRSWDLVAVEDEGDMATLVASIVEARKKRAAKSDVTLISVVL